MPICEACRQRRHERCAGRERCYCQHRPPRAPAEPATGSPGE